MYKFQPFLRFWEKLLESLDLTVITQPVSTLLEIRDAPKKEKLFSINVVEVSTLLEIRGDAKAREVFSRVVCVFQPFLRFEPAMSMTAAAVP